MALPIGYDISALSPIIVIKDLEGVEQFRYETPQVVNGSPIQDFSLAGGILSKGINEDQGSLTFTIRDDAELLIDKSKPNFPSTIKHGWEIQLFLGKDPNTVNLWYTGIINNISTHDQTKTNTLEISSLGWGSILASRYSSMDRTQRKLADGITPDITDLTTKISELYKDLIQDTDHLIVKGHGLPPITAGEVEDLPFQIGDYRKNKVSLGSEMQEMAQMAGCYWGVDQNKQAFLFQRGTQDSGILITNDFDSTKVQTTNWDQEKIGFIKSQDLVKQDSINSSGVTSLITTGSQRKIVDHNQPLSNNLFDPTTTHHAFSLIPGKDNISQISLFLVRVASITTNLHVSIIGANDDANKTPNINDLREKKIIPFSLLEKELLTSPGGERYIDIRFNKFNVTVGEKLFVLVEQTIDPSNALTIDQQDDQGEYFISADLINWGLPLVGDAKFISYQSKSISIIIENTTTKALRVKEEIVTLPDEPDEQTILQIAKAISNSKSKIIRNYDPVLVTPMTLPPELGKLVKYEDVQSGFSKHLSLVGYDLEFNAYDKNSLGATEIQLSFQDIYI